MARMSWARAEAGSTDPPFEHVPERGRRDLDAAQVEAVGLGEDRVDAVPLLGGRVRRQPDEHGLPAHVQASALLRGQRAIVRDRGDRAGRPVEVEVGGVRPRVQANQAIEQALPARVRRRAGPREGRAEPRPDAGVVPDGFPHGAHGLLARRTGCSVALRRRRRGGRRRARRRQQRDESSVRLASVDVKRHDGQARRVAGAGLEGPVPADLHGTLGSGNGASPAAASARTGNGDVRRSTWNGSAGPGIPPRAGTLSRTSCWASTTVPARRIASAKARSSVGAPGSSNTTSKTMAAAPPRWRASTSSACWVRGHRFGFAGRPSASAAGRSMATMRTSGGGGREPRSLKSRLSPTDSSSAAPSGSARKRRPATALSAPMPRGRPSARPRRRPRSRDLVVSGTPPERLVWRGSRLLASGRWASRGELCDAVSRVWRECRGGYLTVSTTALRRSCCAIEMSSPNCAVEMSSHGDMGDRHDESQGGPPAGPGAVGRGREDHDRRGGPGPEDDPAAVPAPQGPVSGRGRPGAGPSPAGPALAPGAGWSSSGTGCWS